MPNLFKINGYYIFFWSNENLEPIHVHVGKTVGESTTKIWITSDGMTIRANNKSRIKERDLKELEEFINEQSVFIVREWINFHGYEKYIR